jgi:UDP-3-O-[3-hydroxymyristoyl] glucosamine N-acyltransferase
MTTLGELAKVLELELRGDPARSIASLAALESATAGDLSFVSEK